MNYELRIKYLKYVLVLLISTFVFYSVLICQDYPVRSGSIIFLELKCNGCHSVKTEAIECIDTLNKSYTDLSKVGDFFEKEILKDFLMKKVKLKNKKHPEAFKGKNEDLEVLCNWLHNLSSVQY